VIAHDLGCDTLQAPMLDGSAGEPLEDVQTMWSRDIEAHPPGVSDQ
jgi:hypothetical protein